MQTYKISSGWKQAAIALAVAGAPVLSAQAANLFQVAPSVLGGPAASFTSGAISGTSSTRIQALDPAGNSVAGTGFIEFTSFNQPPPLSGGIVGGITGLGSSYQLWLTFSYSATIQPMSPATFGLGGSLYNLTALSFSVFGRQGLDTTFSAATLAAAPTVNLNGGNPNPVQTIGSGSLISGTAGLNGILGQPGTGAFFNASTSYANTAFGNTFFFDPSPFYTLAFNSFINTGPGLSIDLATGVIAINQQVGNAEFAGVVSTPSTLALVGLGLIASGFVARRRSKQS